MTDLLSLSEEVLREVYQKLQPEGSRRVHYPVWLKLRTFLQGLIVKSDSNCWIWYHRKLKVIAERRFVEVEKVYYHSLMGKYFSDTLEQSQYEGQSISHQPLTLSTIRVWFPEAQINTRRCIESTHHLLLGRRLREAASELCNLEYVCACVLAGEGFQVVENISKLHEDVNNKLSITGLRGLEAEIISKLCQYQRWLCQNMKDIVQDPRGYISLSVIRQPVASTMKIEIDNMLQQTASNIISSSNWSMNSWVRGKPMGQLPHQSFAVLLEIVGHNAYVHDVQWTTNSYRIISASEDCTIKFWNGRTGRLEYSLLTEEPVHRISTSPNGRLIAIFSGQCTLKVCDAETGRLFHSLKAHRVKALSWHADSSKLICTENSDHVRYTRIFNLKTGKQHTTMLGESKALAWSRKGDKLASAAFHDNCVKIWDAQEYVLLQSLEGHFKTINALSWNPAGTHIVSAADDCTARIWNVSECALVFMLKDSSPIVAVRWSTDGQRVATASVDAMIKIWDTFRGRLVKTIKDSSNVAITSLDWSPDCSFVVSGSRDGTLKTWGISNGDQLESYLGHEQCVNHVAWAPKGTAFASASDDGCIKLWDKGSTQVLKSFRGHNSKVFWVSWCLSGEKLYSAGEDNTIRVWDVKNGTELQCISCDNAYAVLVDSNQTFVAVTEYRPSNDSTKLFDVATGKLVSTLEGPANSISWAPDGGVIAIGGANTSIYLCFGESGVVFRCWKAHTKTITATAWSPNGSMLASASEDMTIKLWDASSSSILVTLEDHETSVCHICWSPDTETLATACADFSVKIWNTMDRKMTHRLTGHKKLISALRWCPFSSKVVSSSFDKSIKIWDVGAEETLQQSPEGHNDWVCHVGWNSDGTQLLSSSKDKTIKVWDVETRSILRSNIAHDDVIDFVEFDHLDRFILSCSQDKSLKLWEKDTFRLIQTIQQPYSPAYVVAACWNPSGTMIAYCTTDNTINIWEVKSKQITNTFLLDCAASSIQWSSDNTKLATGSDDKKIDVWDAESGVLLRPMENVTSSIICVSWSPDCNKIAAGSRSPVLQVWNAQSGKVIHALTGHFGWISSVAWSGDGTTLVSGSWDKSVCVWQTDTGQLLKTLHGHNGPVFSVSWHPNSCKIASASADSTIVVWETVQQGHNNQHGWIH